jgi:FkbM family methyltransferase
VTLKALVRRPFRALGLDVVRAPAPTLGGHLTALFESMRIDCVLDAGAHFGEYGAFLREHGYRGAIVSFEPIAANLAQLRGRAAGDPRWTVLGCALGSADERREINVAASTDLSSFLEPNDYVAQRFRRESVVLRKECVDVRRLDSVIDDIPASRGPRIFLKMDTQGFDLEILRGAAGCLERVAALQSEMTVTPLYAGMPEYLEALAFCGALGFRPTGFFPVNRTAELCIIDFDCVLRRVA